MISDIDRRGGFHRRRNKAGKSVAANRLPTCQIRVRLPMPAPECAISSAVERVPYKHRVGGSIPSLRTRQMRGCVQTPSPTVVGDDGRYRNLPQSANVPRRRQGLQSPVAGFDSLGARQNRCEVTGVVTAPAVNRVFVGSIPTLTANNASVA